VWVSSAIVSPPSSAAMLEANRHPFGVSTMLHLDDSEPYAANRFLTETKAGSS
jgi:hypothetical protein